MPKASKPPSVSRERILEAASNRFIRSGYTGTTLGSIAAEIGITTPAIYWHFNSKDELFSAALEQVLMSFVSYVRSSVVAKDPVSHLAQIVAAHVTWQLEQADIASAYAASLGMKPLLAGLGKEHQTKLLSIQRDYMQELKATLAEGKRAGILQCPDEGIAAYAIVTMCEYVHVWFKPGGLLTVEQVRGEMVRLALRAVGVEEGIAFERFSGRGSLQLPN